ncbi:hypothetical protein ACFSHP_24750 [Novosphingobium panipatense]
MTFAVVGQDGILVAKTTLDFDSPPPLSTVADAVAAINDGLAPAGSASFENGVLSISAASGKNGIAIGQDPDSPSDRAGIGFSQFFGLNNLIRSDRNALAPSGFASDDPHGFSADDAAQIVLRDPSGKLLASHELDVSAGGTWGDLVDGLNGSDLGSFGRFALDGTGRITFTASTANAGAAITILRRDGPLRHGAFVLGTVGSRRRKCRARDRPCLVRDGDGHIAPSAGAAPARCHPRPAGDRRRGYPRGKRFRRCARLHD